MKFYLLAFCLMLGMLGAQTQLSMQINLPGQIAADSAQPFQVKISKGNVTNFSKFQMAVPEGVAVQGVESSGGSFSFADQQVKVIWAITPPEPEITLEMVLVASAPGTYTLQQKYYYLENEGKREVEMDPFSFTVLEPGKTPDSQPLAVTLRPHIPAALPQSASGEKIDPTNPGELRMHALQLKKDSREASKVGEAELAKAKDNLEDANTVIRQAEYLDESATKAKILKQATAAKERAEMDIEIANKILLLAKSLEDNANDIEKLNPVASNTTPAKPAAGRGAAPATAEPPASDQLVYRLQLGAFGKNPGKSAFRALGNVTITNENGLFKVLLGTFSSKEEAVKKRGQVIGQGFDAFIVSYKNGVRVN